MADPRVLEVPCRAVLLGNWGCERLESGAVPGYWVSDVSESVVSVTALMHERQRKNPVIVAANAPKIVGRARCPLLN